MCWFLLMSYKQVWIFFLILHIYFVTSILFFAVFKVFFRTLTKESKDKMKITNRERTRNTKNRTAAVRRGSGDVIDVCIFAWLSVLPLSCIVKSTTPCRGKESNPLISDSQMYRGTTPSPAAGLNIPQFTMVLRRGGQLNNGRVPEAPLSTLFRIDSGASGTRSHSNAHP
jgi:hypothetical protein